MYFSITCKSCACCSVATRLPWLPGTINLLDIFPTFSRCSLHVEQTRHVDAVVVVAMVVVAGAVVVNFQE